MEQKSNQQDQYPLAPAKPQGFLASAFNNGVGGISSIAQDTFSFCKHFFGSSSMKEDKIRRELLQAHLNGEPVMAEHYKQGYWNSLDNKVDSRKRVGTPFFTFCGLCLLLAVAAAAPIGVILSWSVGFMFGAAHLGTAFLTHEKKKWLTKNGHAEQLIQHWDYKARVKAHKRLARKQQRTLAHIRQDNP